MKDYVIYCYEFSKSWNKYNLILGFRCREWKKLEFGCEIDLEGLDFEDQTIYFTCSFGIFSFHLDFWKDPYDAL